MTGSSGIMGSRLYPALLQDGWEVVGVTRGKNVSQGGPGRDGANEVHKEFVDKQCDFADPASMDSGVFDGCSHVLHLAAQGSPGATFEDTLRSNIISTYHAYEASSVFRVLYRACQYEASLPKTIEPVLLRVSRARLPGFEPVFRVFGLPSSF